MIFVFLFIGSLFYLYMDLKCDEARNSLKMTIMRYETDRKCEKVDK